MNARDELTDAVDRARRGDARGFELLFRTFNRQVAGYLRARGVRDADDLGNEVFLRAFKTIATFQGDADRFRAWLFTIAHHAAVDDARRRGRRPVESGDDRAPEPVGGDVEDDVLVRLARERVQILLDGVSPDQRDVLTLRVVSDLSVEETAAVLGKSHEAVKALQRRGLAALRREILDREGVPR